MNLPDVVAILIGIPISLILIVTGGRARFVGGICFLLVVSAGGYFLMRDRRIASREVEVRIGDSESRVRSLLGAPTAVTDCSIGYGGYKRGELERREIPADCAEEFWYYSFYFPQSSTYSFDRDKKLIGKYVLTSP